jgi:hypothetical protein
MGAHPNTHSFGFLDPDPGGEIKTEFYFDLKYAKTNIFHKVHERMRHSENAGLMRNPRLFQCYVSLRLFWLPDS